MDFTFGNIAVLIAAVAGLVSGIWAIRKVTAESESVVVTTAEKVVMLVRSQLELSDQHRLADLEKYNQDRQAWAQDREAMRKLVEEHGHRIEKLEMWIVARHPDVDPRLINGPQQ